MYDAVEVYNGPTTIYPKIGKYCGPFRPGRLESTSNKMLITLKTDASNSNLGFVATFISAQQQTASNMLFELCVSPIFLSLFIQANHLILYF